MAPPQAAVFLPAKAGLFLRPQAAFLTVGDAVVMRRMTVGMVTMARRKTRFPTDIGSSPTKAKPTASVTAFCVYLIPLQHQRVEYYNHSVTLNRPTPPYYIYRAHLSAHIWVRKSPRPGGAGDLDEI